MPEGFDFEKYIDEQLKAHSEPPQETIREALIDELEKARDALESKLEHVRLVLSDVRAGALTDRLIAFLVSI